MAESVEFNGAHLKRSVRLPPAIIQRIPLLGGVGVGLFGKFNKTSSVIGRLLVGATRFEGLQHPLSHTDAIETLIEAREAKREELRQAEAAEEAAERAAKMENKIDLKLDEATVVPNKHMKPAPLKHLPPYVTVVAPAVSGLEPLEMKVLMSNNVKAPLWLELTVPNVSYLHRLIVKQIQEGSIHNVHPRVRRGLDPVGVAGVSRIYNDPKAGSYRYSLKSIENRHTAKLDCSVMAPGDTSLHAVVPSAASGSSNARCSTDAGLSAQEEGKKRTKTEARGQTGSAGRSDSCGSAGASNSDFPMIKDSMVRNTLWRYAVGNTGAMGSAVSMSTSSGSGQARGSSSAASGVQESSFNRMKTELKESAEAEGPSRLKLESSSVKRAADPPIHSHSYNYFERQSGAWCGMHALNNLLRGPMVTKEACKLAAQRVRESFAGAEVESAHLDPETGFLSIDVINLLGSANLGIHVEETPTAWEVFRHCHGARALINWNQRHWTVLEAWPPDAPTRWRHTNSIDHVSSNLRYGRAH